MRVAQRAGRSKQTILKEIFIGKTDAEDKAPILLPPDAMSLLIGKHPYPGKDCAEGEGDN